MLVEKKRSDICDQKLHGDGFFQVFYNKPQSFLLGVLK